MNLAAVVPPLLAEQRRYSRVQLNLPVRLRMRTPFGLTAEVSQTLEASRGGLLVRRAQTCEPGARLWVTFPFDSEMCFNQPEIPARVVRVSPTPSGDQIVAIQLEALPQRLPEMPARRNRRRSIRTRLAIPLQVRQEGSPWAEETMTIDISDRGMQFGTSRVYKVGEDVRVKLVNISWPGRIGQKEIVARVVRVTLLPEDSEQRVAVSFSQEVDPFK